MKDYRVIRSEVRKSIKEHLSNIPHLADCKIETLREDERCQHPDDKYNFWMVAVSQTIDGEERFHWWSCWNQSTKSLNYGHYDYIDYDHLINDMMEMMKPGWKLRKVYTAQQVKVIQTLSTESYYTEAEAMAVVDENKYTWFEGSLEEYALVATTESGRIDEDLIPFMDFDAMAETLRRYGPMEVYEIDDDCGKAVIIVD